LIKIFASTDIFSIQIRISELGLQYVETRERRKSGNIIWTFNLHYQPLKLHDTDMIFTDCSLRISGKIIRISLLANFQPANNRLGTMASSQLIVSKAKRVIKCECSYFEFGDGLVTTFVFVLIYKWLYSY